MVRRRTGTAGPPQRRAVHIYVWLVTVLAAGTAVLAAALYPLKPTSLTTAVILCAMGILSVMVRERDVGRTITFSFTSIIMLSSVALIGPFGAAMVGATSQFGDWSRQRPLTKLFNVSMHAVIGSLGGFAYVFLGGLQEVGPSRGAGELLLHLGLPLMLADVVQCLTNAVILAGVVRLSQGVPPRLFVAQMLSTSGLAYVGYGVIGFLFVILWIPAGVGPFSAVLVLAPLFVARWAFVQYGDEQRAHERTLKALVAAVETKDVYARGHSERVARLCDLMAETLSLGHHRTEALRYAGMLHDIGKIGVPTKLLRKSGQLTDDDYATLALHPMRGTEMVREIDFLKESSAGILHHHERYDGRGYPAGLSGPQIPEYARIIAVADAFDSLTTTRAYREAYSVERALQELRQRSGTQFDPAVVAALERAMERHPWEPTGLDADLLATAGTAYDHDDPAAADEMAGRPDLVQRIQRRRARVTGSPELSR